MRLGGMGFDGGVWPKLGSEAMSAAIAVAASKRMKISC